ncbi:MAG: WYL domain-containing protein [Deltaproteobacteria bacterium]|nr:WYL domain-containing protein [Deltaproteobacteria bacterium]
MGLDVSLRTIQRDLKELSRHFPIISDEERISGWKWAEDAPSFDIPGMDPQAALAFKMIDLHLNKMLPRTCFDFLRPYSRRADEVLQKVEKGGLRRWPEKIARLSRHLTLPPPEVDRLIMGAVYEALLIEKQLEISYRNRSDEEIRAGVINPLGLVFVDNVAYLVCTFWQYHDIRQIALHRILSATIIDEPCCRPPQFNLQDYIAAGSFDFPAGSGTIELHCLFDAYVAKHLAEAPLSPAQSITPAADGRVMLAVRIENTAHLKWWLLGFGDQVEVVAPEDLRREIRQILEAAVSRYQ